MFNLLLRTAQILAARSNRLKLGFGFGTLSLSPPMSPSPMDPNMMYQQQTPNSMYSQGPLPPSPYGNKQYQPQQTAPLSARNHTIDWNQFCYNMLARGEVKSLIIRPGTNTVEVHLYDNAIINGQPAPMTTYFLQVPNMNTFEMKLRDFERQMGIKPGDEVPIVYSNSSILPNLIGTAIFLGFLYAMSRNIKVSSPQNLMSSFSKAKFTLVDPTNRASDAATIRFRDVAGLKEAKVEIMEFVDYLKNSDKFLTLGAKLPKGVLLTGPPGCGKTLLAKAVATESNVPFLALAGSDFVEMIGGVGASRVRSLFKQANKLAPCIVYIDEIDSIGKKRSTSANMQNDESERTLNQLLVEMDGMMARKSVIVLASTNRSEVLDAALLRPGRFDRQILIDYPTLEERRELFEKHASKIKLDEPAEMMSRRVAQLTPGMSGADIANVCNEAALHAARKDKNRVTQDDIEYAIERVVGGTEKRSSSISKFERRVIAYHESGHALVAWLLKHADPVLKVSIVPRTNNILGFAQYIPSERRLHSPEEFNDMMCAALGGRCAELIKFNHLSTGAQNDLRKVTEMALAQVRQFGFDSVIGQMSFPRQDPSEPGKRPYSKRLAGIIDHRANLIIKTAFDRTYELLSANMDKLNLMAETLITKEVINSDDIEKLIGPRPINQPTFQKSAKTTIKTTKTTPDATITNTSPTPASPAN